MCACKMLEPALFYFSVLLCSAIVNWWPFACEKKENKAKNNGKNCAKCVKSVQYPEQPLTSRLCCKFNMQKMSKQLLMRAGYSQWQQATKTTGNGQSQMLSDGPEAPSSLPLARRVAAPKSFFAAN